MADGRIIVLGTVYVNLESAYAVAQLTPSGGLDSTFGLGGWASVMIGTSHNWGREVLIQPDGRIVVAGATHSGQNMDFGVVRLTADGRPDSTFGVNGTATTPANGLFDMGLGMALQPDGRIVVVGCAYGLASSSDDFGIARFMPDGSLDTSFGSGGMVTTSFGTGYDCATRVVVQPDGGIVVAGFTSSAWAFARYTVDGTLDGSFGSGGRVTLNIGGSPALRDFELMPDGRFIAAGGASSSGTFRMAVGRMTPTGARDITFGTAGVVYTQVGNASAVASSVEMQVDGRIVAAGYTFDQGAGEDLVVTRHETSGAPDTSFGDLGVQITPVGSANDRAYALGIDPEGRLLAVGYTQGATAQSRRIAVARLLSEAGTAAEAPTPDGPFLVRLEPNPVQNGAVATLSLHSHAHVHVAVHDLLGRAVGTLHDGPLAAGRHRVEVDVRSFSPGVYLMRVTGAGATYARAFTVSR
jgi:uncharacterized delta-60 repeat protein